MSVTVKVTTDGSALTEQITALEPPTRHAYTLSGFRAPFSWLVTLGESEWLVSAKGSGVHVRWDYRFVLTGFWVYPVAAVLLKFFMARAMQRCLDNLARALAVPAPAPAEAV